MSIGLIVSPAPSGSASLPGTARYQVISGRPASQLANDQNVQAAGFGEFGVAVALEHGRHRQPLVARAAGGCQFAFRVEVSRRLQAGQAPRRAPLPARSLPSRLHPRKVRGAFANDNTIVIHGDDVWQQMRASGKTSVRKSRRAPGRTRQDPDSPCEYHAHSTNWRPDAAASYSASSRRRCRDRCAARRVVGQAAGGCRLYAAANAI